MCLILSIISNTSLKQVSMAVAKKPNIQFPLFSPTDSLILLLIWAFEAVGIVVDCALIAICIIHCPLSYLSTYLLVKARIGSNRSTHATHPVNGPHTHWPSRNRQNAPDIVQ